MATIEQGRKWLRADLWEKPLETDQKKGACSTFAARAGQDEFTLYLAAVGRRTDLRHKGAKELATTKIAAPGIKGSKIAQFGAPVWTKLRAKGFAHKVFC